MSHCNDSYAEAKMTAAYEWKSVGKGMNTKDCTSYSECSFPSWGQWVNTCLDPFIVWVIMMSTQFSEKVIGEQRNVFPHLRSQNHCFGTSNEVDFCNWS